MDDIAFLGRKLLNRNVLPELEESIRIRVNSATEQMGLQQTNQTVRLMYSIDKESYVIEGQEETIVCMDLHQMDMMFLLDFFFSSYGLLSVKQPIYQLLYEQLPYFEPRLHYSLLLLQTEKCYRHAMLLHAKHLLDSAQSIDPAGELQRLSEEDWNTFQFVYSLKHKNEKHQENMMIHQMNFYVYHEFAHIKYRLHPEALQQYIAVVEEVGKVVKLKDQDTPEISTEECVCDLYALDRLFEHLYEHRQEYYIGQMIDSYVSVVYNQALLTGKGADQDLFDPVQGILTIQRLPAVINALAALWVLEGKDRDLAIDLLTAFQEASEKYAAMLEYLQQQWGSLYEAFFSHEIDEDISFEQMQKLDQELLDRLSRIT